MAESSPSTSQKRKRKRHPNFTAEQVFQLADFVGKNKAALFGKAGSCSEKVKKRKDETWEKGLRILEAQGLPSGREPSSLHLTWNELASKARKYRDARFATGGGPPPELNPKLEAVLDVLPVEAVEGILLQCEEAGLPASQTSQSSENTRAVRILDTMRPEAEESQDSTGTLNRHHQTQPELPEEQLSYFEKRLIQLEERKLEVLEKMLAVMCDHVYGTLK